MAVTFGTALFLLLGILVIQFFQHREKKAVENIEEISKTSYYDLLESINRLHRNHKNPEQLANFINLIDKFEHTYSTLPKTKRRAIRLRTDLKLKELELRPRTGIPVDILEQVN